MFFMQFIGNLPDTIMHILEDYLPLECTCAITVIQQLAEFAEISGEYTQIYALTCQTFTHRDREVI